MDGMPPLEGMAILREKGAPAGRGRSRGGPLFWTAGMGLALAAFWASGGHTLVRQAPIFAAGAPKAALTISGVTSHVEASGARPVLFVDGEAGNDGDAPATLPPLAISVTGNDGLTTVYTLGTSGRMLEPDERFAFSSRLEVPRNGVTAVSVTFAE
jgi:hypothetical protein